MNRDNNIIKFPGETIADTEAAAAAWLARLTSGAPTLSDLVEFEYWRAASPERDRVYQAMELMWDRVGTGMAAHNQPLSAPPIAGKPSFRLGRWIEALRAVAGKAVARWCAAATAMGTVGRLSQVAAAICVLVIGVQYASVWRYDHHVGTGDTQRIVLADGSVVQLNGGAALNVHVTARGARTVELVRGEAFFDVRHDASRPFQVIVGSGEVRDIGTAFLVSRSGQSGLVTVAEGVVAVAAGGRTDILRAGDQVGFGPYDMQRKPRVVTADIAPWRRGLYIAENKPLGEVLAELNGHAKGTIVVTSRTLAARRVNAVVQFDHIDAWFDALSDTGNVSVRHWGPFTIVSERNG